MNTSQAIPRRGLRRLYLFALLTVLLALAILPLGCNPEKEKTVAPGDTPIVISGGSIQLILHRPYFEKQADGTFMHHNGAISGGKILDNTATDTSRDQTLKPQFGGVSKIVLQHNGGTAEAPRYVDAVVIDSDAAAGKQFIKITLAHAGFYERDTKIWNIFHRDLKIDKVIVTGAGQTWTYFPGGTGANNLPLAAEGKLSLELVQY